MVVQLGVGLVHHGEAGAGWNGLRQPLERVVAQHDLDETFFDRFGGVLGCGVLLVAVPPPQPAMMRTTIVSNAVRL